MEKKYLKLTPAGQLAIKKITVMPLEKAVLERVQKEPGFVIPTQTVYDEQLDQSTLKDMLQKGWLRETDIGYVSGFASPTPTPTDPTREPTGSPASVPPVTQSYAPEPFKEAPAVVLPKVEVSEEEKARSYEDFLKIMGSK